LILTIDVLYKGIIERKKLKEKERKIERMREKGY